MNDYEEFINQIKKNRRALENTIDWLGEFSRVRDFLKHKNGADILKVLMAAKLKDKWIRQKDIKQKTKASLVQVGRFINPLVDDGLVDMRAGIIRNKPYRIYQMTDKFFNAMLRSLQPVGFYYLHKMKEKSKEKKMKKKKND